MKRILTLLVTGSAIAYLVRLLQRTSSVRRVGADGIGANAPEDLAVGATIEDAVLIATESGLANVDPVPLSHVAGEGIDLEGDLRAHRDVQAQRDRLPRGGSRR